MDTSSDGPAASAAAGQGGGGSSSRDLLQQIHSVALQLACDAGRADHVIALQTDSTTQAGVSLADSLAAIRNALTDAHSALTKKLARVGGKGFRWCCNVNYSGVGGAVTSNKTVTKPHRSMAVPGRDEGKRRCVAIEAADAAAAGGEAMDVGGAAAATQQQSTEPTKEYGDPCLSGLPMDVFAYMGSFVTTKTAIRLSKVDKEIRTMATDETSGMFRNFSVTLDEEDSYRRMRDVNQQMRRMVKTASVRASDAMPRFVLSKCVEACTTTLEKLTLDIADYPQELRASTRDVVVFPKVTCLHIHNGSTIEHIRRRRWVFPALTTLRLSVRFFEFDSVLVPSFESILTTSPMIERLEGDRIEVDDGQWAFFTAALGRCPNLITITGLKIDIPSHFGCLNQLKAALSKQWSSTPEKMDLRKKLGFVVVNASIGGDYGQQGAPDLEAFRRWAATVNCKLDWRPAGRPLLVECSSGAATALPAPDGLYGQIATRLAANATNVKLGLGNTPLHKSWRDELIFTKAKTLIVDFKATASASPVAHIIPEWLAERKGERSGPFPAVEADSLSLADMRAARSKHTPFLGGLRSLKSVTFSSLSSLTVAYEFLCHLSVDQLDKVEIEEGEDPLVCDRPADIPAIRGVGCPHIYRLVCGGLSSKAGVTDSIKLALVLRPAHVELEAWLDENELEGESEDDRLDDLHSFADECAEQAAPHYTVKERECNEYSASLTLKLAAK